MSLPKAPKPCSLVIGILASSDIEISEVVDVVSKAFSPPVTASPIFSFDMTKYYDAEMGDGIRRVYLGFGGFHDPGDLADVKLKTNSLESGWEKNGSRRVNLDPGFLSLTNLVLATGKPAAHRIYIGKGIYAEIEYLFEFMTFRCLPWTYLDYKTETSIEFFNKLRGMHKLALRKAQ